MDNQDLDTRFVIVPDYYEIGATIYVLQSYPVSAFNTNRSSRSLSTIREIAKSSVALA